MFGFYFSYSLAPLWDGADCEGVSVEQPPPIRESCQPCLMGDLLLADASLPDPVYRTYCRLRWLAGDNSSLTFTDQDFQAQFGVSRRTLYRHLALLAQRGALAYGSSRGDAIRDYRVEFDPRRLRPTRVAERSRSGFSCSEHSRTNRVAERNRSDFSRSFPPPNSPGIGARPGGGSDPNPVAKVGTDLIAPVARISAQEESGVKVGTLNTSSSTHPFLMDSFKPKKGGREEEAVNLKSAKPGNVNSAKPVNAAGEANLEDRPAQSAQEPPGEAYPLTLSQASCHPEIQLYQQVTGLFPGNNSWGTIIDAISLLRQRHPGEDLEAILAPYWQAWQKGRRKDGSPFDRFSLPWLTEWAINGVIPDRSRPPAPSPMDIINRRLAAMAAAKNKAATEAVAKEGAPTDAAATAVSPVEIVTTPCSS